MGYRAPAFDGTSGPYRYSRDDLLRERCAGLGLGVAVMLDSAALGGAGDAPDVAQLRALFAPREESPVELVRVATTADRVRRAATVGAVLADLGYRVSINVMRASLLAPADIRRAALALAGADVVYLADSFGALTPTGAHARVAALREAFGGQVGFHAHDNLGLALANTLAAIDAGATMVDASVLGMGRGGGNLRTELLLLLLQQGTAGRDDLRATPLHELVTTDLAAMQARHGWGPTLPWMLSGAYGIHPTYAHELLEARRPMPEVLRALEALRTRPDRDTFRAETLAEVLRTAPGAPGMPAGEPRRMHALRA
jgi:4-hydroxy 2-oxovalerate aldolase